MMHARFRAYFTLVFALPLEVVSAREFYLGLHPLDGFLHSVPKGTVAYAVLDGDISLVSFPVNFGTLILFLDFTELAKGNSLTRWR
jgi:hypothetical protein